MSGLPYEFRDKEVSPWDGPRLIEEVHRKSRVDEYLEHQCPDLHEPESNRGYPARDLTEGFVVGVILGAQLLAHSGTLQSDRVIQRIF